MMIALMEIAIGLRETLTAMQEAASSEALRAAIAKMDSYPEWETVLDRIDKAMNVALEKEALRQLLEEFAAKEVCHSCTSTECDNHPKKAN